MFDIRAITRNPTSPKALLLKNKGVEVLKGQLNEKLSTIEALKDTHTEFLWQQYQIMAPIVNKARYSTGSPL